MRIFRYIQLCFLLLSIGVFTSCFDDEGNYEYKEIGEAVIKSIPGVTDHGNKFVCLENEKISLIPEVEFLAGTTAADYEFIWFRFPQDPQGTTYHYEQADTLAMTQNLDYQIVDSSRDYWLIYKVRNKKTGALTEQKFEFIISAVNGWIVLDEDVSGNGDIHIIRDADIVEGGDGRIVANYFSVNNGGKKMRNSRFIGLCPQQPNLYVYSDDGAYIMNASTYMERPKMSYADLFNVTLDVVNPQAANYIPRGYNTEVLVNNHIIYAIGYSAYGWSKFKDISESLKYKAAPAIVPIQIAGDNNAVLFDMENNRFLTVDKWGNLFAPISTGIFDVGAIDPSLKYVYMGEGKDGETCLIMKNETGDLSMFRVNLAMSEPVPVALLDLGHLPEISHAVHYTFGIRGNYMFYATDSKIYSWRFGGETASEFFSVGSGEKIVQMKLYSNSSDKVLNGKVLFVATQKGNEGKVYKVIFNEMSGLSSGKSQEYTGFGIIKDMYYKN